MIKEYSNEEKGQEQPVINESQVAQGVLNTEQKPAQPQTNPTIIDANIQNKYFKLLPNGDCIIGDYDNNQGIKWNQQTGKLDILGGVSVDYLDIPDTVTANSFHVDNVGNAWWGSTVIGTAVAKIEKTGKATFTDIVATGTINAQAGYLSAGVYVDTVNGLLCESGGLNVGTAGHIRGGQTDYATGTGFFLGYSGGAYKFSIGSSTQYLTWDGSTMTVGGLYNFVAGDILFASADTERSTTTTPPMAYTEVKKITVKRGGILRVKFSMKGSGIAETPGLAKIYKNNIAVGTERSNGTSSYVEYSEDISGCLAGDNIQLYYGLGGSSLGTRTVFVKEFRIYVNNFDGSTVVTD